MTYQDRLEAINVAAQERNVLDSIDRPIRGLIQQMNARGLSTVFSCCGFNYDGEEEPKSHSTDGPFVVFFGPESGNQEEYAAFHGFAFDAHQYGWQLDVYGSMNGRALWTIRYRMLESQKAFYQQSPEMKGIHDYELPLMAIKRLEKTLACRPGAKNYTIVDGNNFYDALDGEWQIKPKKNYVYEADVSNTIR